MQILLQVELDTLTGDFHLLRTDLCMDGGQSLNPAIDIGQVRAVSHCPPQHAQSCIMLNNVISVVLPQGLHRVKTVCSGVNRMLPCASNRAGAVAQHWSPVT